jgi:hypothetical protein
MKKCFKCGLELPLTNFYKHPQMADGHVNKCKECNKKVVKGNYINNVKLPGYVEKERKRGRDKYRRLYEFTGKANPKSNAKWMQKYPEKRKAHSMSGKLISPIEGFEKHHWSYNKEHYKDVIWLTKKHHMKAHRFIVYDQERMMYRRFDNNVLLDTKESHLSFIEHCINTIED